MKILLDTNFVITCAKQKIDFETFTEELTDKKIEWLIPQDVLNELGNIKDNKGHNSKDKEAAILAFEILQQLKPKIIELKGKNPNIDIKIVNYLLDKKVILATLDKNLKSRIKNKILTIKNNKFLQIITKG